MARSPSPWLVEKYTAPSGKIYQRYVLDEKGQRIAKDPNATPETVAKVIKDKKEKVTADQVAAEKKAKKITRQLNKAYKAKHAKRLVPMDLLGPLCTAFDRQKKGQGSIRSGDFADRNDGYRVVLFDTDKDWLLIHATLKRGFEYRHKWFFFNPYNEAHIDFDADAHRASKLGDAGIQWPDKSTAEPPAPPVVKVKKARKPKTAA